MEYGLIGLLVLAADIYAIIKIVSSSASTAAKILWVLLILLLPVVGFIIWLIAGPKSSAAHI
ncbi:PLDc N-terminal domain-containing protein [Leisingera sp. S132]|uniref:PLDc N-terminal domain-containing protein n=1 Tax=Leisingera sp. S132 TaxID=2867016 RepID=UPI0021A49DC2|nr:PLDc N-terminal domain-containing protein [Leisingera sp. S132]UWQ81001.1 PLDc N-terminal domain-containing protein [Leisingera sp. S132]